ncbi:MAG: tryptophan synthase subunit alpha [bacterium]|nr:tryptophan synthase subunit alpha [bacterium]
MEDAGRIEACFVRLKAEARGGLFPYVSAGDPSLEFTRRLLPALAAAGADGFEIGVPFSDPLADGPTIQRAGARSLAAGTTLRAVIAMIAGVRGEIPECPLVLMAYYNPVLVYGLDDFARDAARAGVDGVIVPDLPPEEAGDLLAAMAEYPLAPVFMLAPTSPDSRVKLINDTGKGFIYYVGQMGVTGAREALDADLAGVLERINRVKNRPVVVGFGIKTPEQAAEVAEHADGVIVGSALIDVMEAEEELDKKQAAACRYIGSLRAALGRSGATT